MAGDPAGDRSWLVRCPPVAYAGCMSGNGLVLEKLTNFRDLGGQMTGDGRKLRTGMLYRSSALSGATPDDLAIVRRLGVRVVYDLRSEAERRGERPQQEATALGVPVVSVPLAGAEGMSRRQLLACLFAHDSEARFRAFSSAYYHQIAFDQAATIGAVFQLLAQEEGLPAVIHCTAGKDRTGLVAALVQLLVGVNYEAVVEDYLRTNDAYALRLRRFVRTVRMLTLNRASGERLQFMLMARREVLDQTHDLVVARHGSVAGYLTEVCGVAPQTLDTLRARLLA